MKLRKSKLRNACQETQNKEETQNNGCSQSQNIYMAIRLHQRGLWTYDPPPPNPKYWQNPQNQGWSFRTTDRGSQRSGTPAHTWTAPLLSAIGAGSPSSLTCHLTLHLQIHLRINWCISTELGLLLPAGACWWTFFVVIHVTSKHCLSSVEEKETNGLNLESARLPFFKVMADALSVSNWKVFIHLLNLAKCF